MQTSVETVFVLKKRPHLLRVSIEKVCPAMMEDDNIDCGTPAAEKDMHTFETPYALQISPASAHLLHHLGERH